MLFTPGITVRRILETNVVGTFLLCREAARVMRKRRYDRIVNIGTVAVPMRIEGESIYAASKSAIVTFTQILARELAPFNITCNVVGPTPVETDLIKSVPNELLEKFRTRRHRYTTLSFLLLDYIGGINTLFYTLANGGTLVSVTSRHPADVCRAIEKHRVQLLPTTPTFLNLLLLSAQYREFDLSSLELITYGTEVMPESTLRRLHEVFPNTRVLQTYGLSELGILRSKSKSSESLWVKVRGEGYETKVVDGTLWIRARSAMLGYLNAPSPFDSDGWFNTGDLVEMDGEYIRILGRQSDIINVGGQKVFPAEVESVLLQMDNIKDAVVYGEKNPIVGNIVVACLNLAKPESPVELKKRIHEHCKGRLASFKIPAKVEIASSQQYSARYKRMRKQGSNKCR